VKAPKVIVAGAGPVGLSAAFALTRAGVSVRIIDVTAHVKIRWDHDPSEMVAYLTEEGVAFIAAMRTTAGV
jgi:2-polyprenyl-6-methoxyphenol hydroxylase-like FAD-dependent oxidoreductase